MSAFQSDLSFLRRAPPGELPDIIGQFSRDLQKRLGNKKAAVHNDRPTPKSRRDPFL